MANHYVRQHLEKFIIKALQSLGGSASKKAIKEEIVADDSNDISSENAFEPRISKNGTSYSPFALDINFALINLHTCGYIEDYTRRGDITLTEIGRSANYINFPSDEEREKIRENWDKRTQERSKKKAIPKKDINADIMDFSNDSDDEINTAADDDSNWKLQVLEQIKQFSPKKFESFSRLLLFKMGVQFDRDKGIKMSADHGIDGYGYFESDEFRTAKVVIQCKRYTDNHVSEPDIDKFKGVMASYNADYGVFITTSFFSKQAQAKAMQGGNTVTLIDGQRLVDLIEKYQLHIIPLTTYILEDYYFQKE